MPLVVTILGIVPPPAGGFIVVAEIILTEVN